MRIRRNASRLLGSTTLYAIPPLPPTGRAAAAAAADAECREENNNNNNNNNNVCELNCSPWDLLLLNLDSSLDDYFLTDHSQEEENKGIFGNLVKTEQQEEKPIIPPSSAITSSAAELAVEDATQTDEEKLTKQEKRRKKKAYYRGKEDRDTAAETSTNNNSTSYCKKSDGKGWHCKRRAELPHSLCSHHIAQVRSYASSSNHQASPASESDAIEGMASGTDNYNSDPSGLYYYYEGFGPWRGKRRGSVSACNNACDGNDEVIKDREERDEDIMGNDEYDLDRFDDDDKDEEYRMKQYGEVKKRSGELEKKRPAVIKKRGRKPFKCRSLKSLL